jgi:Arc/MetJ family transcription regulator
MVSIARTNIDIDDELVHSVMNRYGLKTKREAVELALRRLAGEPLSLDEALAMEGSGWEGDLEQMRAADGPAEL